MSKEKINKIKAMVGKAWKHQDGEQYRFVSINVKNDIITIATDGEWLETSVYDALMFMEKFKEIPLNQLPSIHSKGSIPAVEIVSEAVPKSAIEKLSGVLMDNIEKLKTDPTYIAQAKEINNSVNAIVNLAKVEIMLKTPKR